MELEQLFNHCAQQEVDKRTKEEERKEHLLELRCEWCNRIFEELSFLQDKGFKLIFYYNSEFPYITISAGFLFVDITTEHIWKDEDLNRERFYVHSNGALPFKTLIGLEDVIKEISKWKKL